MGTIATSQPLGRETLDIGLVFKQGWRLFVKDIGPLIVGALIVAVLSIVSLGILAGPLAAGLYGTVVKRVRDGQQPEVGDVFGQMSRFWAFFARRPRLYQFATKVAMRVLGNLGARKGCFRRLPLASGWTKFRDLPAPAGQTFQELWAEKKRNAA